MNPVVVVLPDEDRGEGEVPPVPGGGLRCELDDRLMVHARTPSCLGAPLVHRPTTLPHSTPTSRPPTASPSTTCRWCSAGAASSPTSRSRLPWAGAATSPSCACLARRSTRAPTCGCEGGREGGKDEGGERGLGVYIANCCKKNKRASYHITSLSMCVLCVCLPIGGVALK